MRPLRKAARAALIARLDRAVFLAQVRALSVSDGVCVLPEGATYEIISAALARPDVRTVVGQVNDPGGAVERYRARKLDLEVTPIRTIKRMRDLRFGQNELRGGAWIP